LTLEELRDKPPERINMRELAKRAGVSATAIYYYFESKEALFEVIKFEALDEAEARVRAAVAAAGGGPKERLLAFMRAFAAWCLERPETARLFMQSLPPRLDLDEEGMQRYYSLHLLGRDLLEEAVAAGLIPPRDLDLEVSLAQSALWGIVSQYLDKRIHPRFWKSPDELIERLADLLVAEKGVDR